MALAKAVEYDPGAPPTDDEIPTWLTRVGLAAQSVSSSWNSEIPISESPTRSATSPSLAQPVDRTMTSAVFERGTERLSGEWIPDSHD